jgi:hypothetical protein
MSRVYFHTKSKSEEIGGAERHWWGHLCWRLTSGVLDIADSYDDEIQRRLYSLVPDSHYLKANSTKHDARSLLTSIHVSSGRDPVLAYKGRSIDTFGLQLNTALATGSDAVKLAARLHGSCEIHCWVDDLNREWLAGLIEQGIADASLRKSFPDSNHRGYDQVLHLLRHPEHRGPVVTSYSVSESFPGVHLLEESPSDERLEELYEINKDERWDRSVEALRSGNGRVGAELRPDNWQTFRFTHKLSALDLIAVDWEDRLDAAIADGRL